MSVSQIIKQLGLYHTDCRKRYLPPNCWAGDNFDWVADIKLKNGKTIFTGNILEAKSFLSENFGSIFND